MGRNKKGFNWKARQQSEIVVDRSAEKEVQVDLQDVHEGVYDDCNVLVLPSKKRSTKKKGNDEKKAKMLSKKDRKKLEKVLENKEKKLKRADLLESLAAHQATKEELEQFISIAEVQTGKLKRKHENNQDGVTVNTIAGSNKKHKMKKTEQESDDDSHTDDESIHTSDMSTDEEDSGVVTDGQIDSSENRSNLLCVEDKMDSERCGESGVHVTKSGTSENESMSNLEHYKNICDKFHVRGTSCNWAVKMIRSQECETGNISKEMLTSNFEKEKHSLDSKNMEDPIANKPIENAANIKCNTQKSAVERKPAVNIPVTRNKEIQDARLKLPILGEEQIIMENINDHPVVIICGETGSGKTTQVPQFLYEAGYAHGAGVIAVTEPRRVAAVSMSSRVAMEMSLSNRVVSYQIRYEGNVTDDTKIKFMTDGVLLKEVQKDFLLTKYSVVIIDEAHERSVYTDILIGLLSRIVPLRHKRQNPLKLIIMSATLRVEDFTDNKRLFRMSPPVIKVDSRQYPVTIHYNKRTPLDSYLNEAFRKTCKIHRMLPPGGILVFVTGQQEVHTLCKKLKQTFPLDKSSASSTTGGRTLKKKKPKGKPVESDKEVMRLPHINLDSYSVSPVDEEGEEETVDGIISDEDFGSQGYGEDDELEFEGELIKSEAGGCKQPIYVLPLYSMLPSHKQAKVFGSVPEGCRLCIVTTNVAETSLTIPGIKYVVDTGKVKTKFYDKVTGVSTFKITWTSKASANQRAGRAGRLGPGHCYRLFSSAVFNDEFEKFSPAEITRRPVEDLILQMKSMNIDRVINFPYPTPPNPEQIQAAEALLTSLGAVAVAKQMATRTHKGPKKEAVCTITPLGRVMSCFPVSPRYAKMLAIGHQHSLLPYVVAIVSTLSVQELFMEVYTNPQDEEQSEKFKQRLIQMTALKKHWAGAGHSLLLGDLMVMLKAMGSCEYEGCSQKFCEDHGIHHKAMMEVRKLRVQLTNAVNTVMPDANICVDPKMMPPDNKQAKILRQIVLSGMGDHVARKLPDLPNTDPNAKKVKHGYQCPNLEEPIFIHPTSVLYRERPEYVVFQHIEETSKLYMKGITAVEPEWFPVFATSHVILSKPLEEPAPRYDDNKGQVMCYMTGTFGNQSWALPAVELEYPTGIEKIKWFARFLLEGLVVNKLKSFTCHLLSPPATMIKTWAKLQPRTEVLLKALVSERVDCKDSLLKLWKKQPSYLLSAFREWLPESKHTELSAMWPPCNNTT